jgi:hypothetical protein
MLGLVGAHVLLQGSEPRADTVRTVLDNLGRLLGADSPDLRALELMAARRFGGEIAAEPFERPPMLRPGLEAVIEAGVQMPSLVPGGGLLAQIALERFVDSPWTTWKPLLGAPGRTRGAQGAGTPNWVKSYVADAAMQAARKGDEPDLAAIATRAVLPLESVSEAYEELRRTTPSGAERTMAMEQLVARTRRDARTLGVAPEEARRLFFEGGQGDRMRALALMQGDPSIRDLDVALDGVSHSRSAFEQYHALRLAQQMIPVLDEDQRAELRRAVERQRGASGWIKPGMDRWYLSQRLLADL